MSGIYKGEDREIIDQVDITSLGSQLKKTADEIVDLTENRAEWLLGNTKEVHEFAGDRPLKEKHVDYLVGAMRRGTFRPELVTIVVCEHDGKLYRMNGQHTAWARIYLERKRWPCKVRMLTYRAATEEDMRRLYASIDRSSPRSKGQVVGSYLKGSPGFEKVSDPVLRHLSQGFALWKWEASHERNANDGDAVAFHLKTGYYDLTMKVAAFLGELSQGSHKHLLRAPVVAAMYATFEKAPQIAREFWMAVANGVGVDTASDARLRLRDKLMQTSVGLGGGASSAKAKMTQEEMFRICLRAWNRHREGKPVNQLKPGSQGKRPAVK